MSRCIDCAVFRKSKPLDAHPMLGKVVGCSHLVSPKKVVLDDGREFGRITVVIRKSLDPACDHFKAAVE